MIKRKSWPRNSPTVIRMVAPRKDKLVKWFQPKMHGWAVWFVVNARCQKSKVFGLNKLRKYSLAKPLEAQALMDSVYHVLEVLNYHRDGTTLGDVHNKLNPPWVPVPQVMIEIKD